MKSYYFIKKIEADGSASLSGLPPYKEVEIIVLYPEASNWHEELDRWLTDIRSRHPFRNMNKEDIIKQLQQTRELVWSERHAD